MTTLWQGRGLLTLWGFGVATLLGAVITFIAHNWGYLSTAAKLSGLGALLIIAAALWIWRKLDGQVAASFGIAAQVLIGVWLAAAGQIFQAPGGLQDLTLSWAVLGLPFALASRSWAHWAVWLGVVTLAAASPVGLMLNDVLGQDRYLLRVLVGGLALGLASYIGMIRSAPTWFVTLSAFVSSLCFVVFGLSGFSSEEGLLIVAAILQAGLGYVALRQSKRAASAIYAAGAMLVFTAFLIWIIWDFLVGDTTLGILLSVIITGGATFALIRIFQFILAKTSDREVSHSASETGEEIALDGPGETPWYMDLFIAFGGFITALLGVSLLGSFIGLFAALAGNEEMIIAGFGLVLYVPAIILRRRHDSQFLRFFFNTLILLGGAAFIGGVAFAVGHSSETIFGALLLVLSTLTAILIPRDRILHVVLAGGWITGFVLLLDWTGLSPDDIALISVFVLGMMGVVFGTETLAGRRRLMLSFIFLIAAMGAGLAHDVSSSLSEWSLLARSVDVALLICGTAWLAMRLRQKRLPSFLVLGVLALIAAILPVGAGAALLLLLLGYSVRSSSLFGIGVVSMAYFLFATYYDLSLTLMQLSGIMALTGGALLALWWVASRHVEVAS